MRKTNIPHQLQRDKHDSWKNKYPTTNRIRAAAAGQATTDWTWTIIRALGSPS